MITIYNSKDINTYEKELKEFEKIYKNAFPIKNEREPFKNIIKRIGTNSCPKTKINLIKENNSVIGWIIIDYYPEINTIHPIYMAVKKEYRKQWIGTNLLNNCPDTYKNIKHIFIECEDPSKITEKDNNINPNTRLKFYKKLWYNIVPINYIQPPLSKWRSFEKKLLLLHKWEKLDRNALKNFLYNLYKWLNHENSNLLKKLFKEIENTIYKE